MKAVETVCKASMSWMSVKRIAQQGLTHPFGDHRTVKQAFPAAIDTKEADPFLMCDYFDVKESKGPVEDPDEFPIDWHPHRGFDICSYLRSGIGRHGDSLGNRETYETPGMQWMSTGSGVVHAEGGATPKGQLVQGFQIWINVPADSKMQDPRYGTVPTDELPQQSIAEGATARVLAGHAFGVKGPFQTVQPVQMIDFELEPNSRISFDVEKGLDTAIVYVYEGEFSGINQEQGAETAKVEAGNVVLLDASSDLRRGVELTTPANSFGKALLFAGKKLREPIAWHGPIVMNTQQQVQETLKELRSGKFPPVRVDWDYKRVASKPKD
jgi:quercetin 2,3-dioxygenase